MKIRRSLIIMAAMLLVLSPLPAAKAQNTAANPKTTQTTKQAAKPAAKPAATDAQKEPAPVDNRYASDPTGWWNDLWTDAHFSYDLFAKSTLLRGENVPGGGLSLGVETEKFRFEGYAQADYFLRPFAGDGIATMELNGELGVNASWKFLEFWAFDIWASCDIGYFTQIVGGLPYAADQYVMGYSGLMVRPKLLTELKIAKYYGLTLGFYYQIPVYPAYGDYSGLGIMLSIC